jgi:glycosyltransferase involved in cell wall biosynthesis
LRVAYFPDSFHEINGVAHTSRQFEAFARRRQLPFLCVRAGRRAEPLETSGTVTTLELPRGMFSFPLDKDLSYDLGFARHLGQMMRALRQFRPDLIHITGPSEVGMLGAWLASRLHVPLAASWHTNVHEYAATRSNWFLDRLPHARRAGAAAKIEAAALWGSAVFYRKARVLFAPNPQLCALLEKATRRTCLLMPRGVDAEMFSPARRTRAAIHDQGGEFVLGFVGRLSVEKNIQLLARVHDELIARGVHNVRFLIVGQGAEEPWLRQRMPRATFTGVLRGQALAEAYANMDLFLFPSHTDTFGNVVLEAMASGVPAVVTPDGGPCHLVREGATGRITGDDGFTAAVLEAIADAGAHAAMSRAARAHALGASWDAVFEGVYAGYGLAISRPLPSLGRLAPLGFRAGT